MMARVMAGLLFLAASLSCQGQEPMDATKAEATVYEKLYLVAPTKGVDVSGLPPPVVERQGEKLIYDFKDRTQNAWIVVIVHPDGFAEISFDEIEESPQRWR